MSHIGNNKLTKNFNRWAIYSLISNTQKLENTLMAWKIVVGQKITIEVSFQVIRKFRNEIVVRAKGSQAKKVLGDLSVGAEKLNFYLPADSVLFQTEVKQILSSGDVIIKFPEMIAQVERRSKMRLFLEEGLSLEVNFFKENHGQRIVSQKFNKSCYDISAGGLSFIASKSEVSFFKKNDQIKNLSMIIDGELVELKARVMDILDIEPNEHNQLIYKGYKVCVNFEDISSQIESKIDAFVFRYIELDEVV